MLAQMLREQGAEVDYEPPTESRNLGADAHTVVVIVTAAATYDVVKAGVKMFTDRFPRAKVDLPPKGSGEQPNG